MLILLCFTQLIHVGFCLNMLVCHLCVFCGHHCHGCERTCKIRSRSCCGMGVFIFSFQISILFGKNRLVHL